MNQVKITPGPWLNRLEVNAHQAIYHQWEQLEASGCIQNFRIAAGLVTGFREGFFFADSDAYKWLEAASRIVASHPEPRLAALIDDFINLLAQAQNPDGYLYTYNQILFPGVRWENLQIEHELYCHGHLIEAGVTHAETTGQECLFEIARRAADRIVADFQGKGPQYTSGHEEIEIALLRLHQAIKGDTAYLEMARQFIEQRGRTPVFGLSYLRQNRRANQRWKSVMAQRQDFLTAHPEYQPYQPPPENRIVKPQGVTLRWHLNAFAGKYNQQQAPIRKQVIPVGHSVRFVYLETAAAMLARESGDNSLLPPLKQAWERMVTCRMFVTGGIGSLPALEGFGNDYELDPQVAYAETCAAVASLFWNWQMVLLTGEAKYADLFEWQLNNAALPGMSLDGKAYFYCNPLASQGGITRQAWFSCPCCPSNLSRILADLGKYIYSSEPGTLSIHQYISSVLDGEFHSGAGDDPLTIQLQLESQLPSEGHVRIVMTKIAPKLTTPSRFRLRLRQPSWASQFRVYINGQRYPLPSPEAQSSLQPTASGYDPRLAAYQTIERDWQVGDTVDLDMDMPIRLLKASPKVKGHRGKVTITRGPIVYCLESIDNAGIDIFSARIDPKTLVNRNDPDLLGGIQRIGGTTVEGNPLTFIPYHLWANRGPSKVAVWIHTARE